MIKYSCARLAYLCAHLHFKDHFSKQFDLTYMVFAWYIQAYVAAVHSGLLEKWALCGESVLCSVLCISTKLVWKLYTRRLCEVSYQLWQELSFSAQQARYNCYGHVTTLACKIVFSWKSAFIVDKSTICLKQKNRKWSKLVKVECAAAVILPAIQFYACAAWYSCGGRGNMVVVVFVLLPRV